MDFGRTEPLLMKVQYTEVAGLKLSTTRRFAAFNWQAPVNDDAAWTHELITDIKFSNSFGTRMFRAP